MLRGDANQSIEVITLWFACAKNKPDSTKLRSFLSQRSVSGILTLTTDFGTQDAYVAAMKGVILGINPEVRIVDITHQIAPQDIMEAAFVLRDAAPFFPDGTVHLAVVDPGVGTARKAVALRRGEHHFVGPDNGLFALLLDGSEPDELVVLDRPQYWRTEGMSNTFHGRDLFAPVAAYLSAGCSLCNLGTPASRLESLHWLRPLVDEQGIQGWVVHIDRFGNCMTNIPRSAFEAYRHGREVKCYVATAILKGVQPTYAAVAPGEPLALFGSSGFLEFAVNGGNASDLLSIRKGASVNLVFLDKRQPDSLHPLHD